MLEFDASLEELEQKLLSYDSFKKIVQQYLSRLLGSDQDTLSVVAEMLEAVKTLSSTRSLPEGPTEAQRVVELRKEALYRYGGVATVEDVPAPPPLKGGTVKVDDPQVYGMSLICTWLDCIVSNPEQSLDSLRKVFLRTSDTWEAELNRVFHINLAQLQPVRGAAAWVDRLLAGQQASTLHLARISNLPQALGVEDAQPSSAIPLAVWMHLLETRPAYDLSSRFALPEASSRTRWVALRREGKDAAGTPSLYRISLDPTPPPSPLPAPISLDDLRASLGCALAAPVRLEVIDKIEQLRDGAPATFAASLPLGNLLESCSLMLNTPPEIVLHDMTPPRTPPPQRIVRISSTRAPLREVRLCRIQPLRRDEWPSQGGWIRRYRFADLADIGVQTCPPGAYLEVLLRDDGDYGEGGGEIHFHRWGESGASLCISAAGLRRAAQTGTLVLLQASEEIALDVLNSLQGLIGPAAQRIDPIVSRLDCQVRWRPQMGPELFE